MISDLPCEMTKQILSAPAKIIRSTRYSLTAEGRSSPPPRRRPRGSIPSRKPAVEFGCRRRRLELSPTYQFLLQSFTSRIKDGLQLTGARFGAVFSKRAFASVPRDGGQF